MLSASASALGGAIEGTRAFGVEIIHLLLGLLLAFGEFAGGLPGFAELFRETAGRFLAQVVADLFEIVLRPRALGECLRDVALLQGFAGLPHRFTRLVELLAGVARAV